MKYVMEDSKFLTVKGSSNPKLPSIFEGSETSDKESENSEKLNSPPSDNNDLPYSPNTSQRLTTFEMFAPSVMNMFVADDHNPIVEEHPTHPDEQPYAPIRVFQVAN